MPKFKVRSTIQHGTRDDKGVLQTKEYAVGDSIELTKEEAQSMGHALEKAPLGIEHLPKDVQDAVKSVLAKPEHRDSGIQLDWKVDAAAREATQSGVSAQSAAANEAIGAGYERSNEPDVTTEGGERSTGGPIRASDIAPGENVHEGEKKPAPQGSAATDPAKKAVLTETKSPAAVSQVKK